MAIRSTFGNAESEEHAVSKPRITSGGELRDRGHLSDAYHIAKTIIANAGPDDIAQARIQRGVLPDHALGNGRASVWRAAQVVAICERIPALLRSSVLTVSHVIAVSRLEPAKQADLLCRAEAEEWTVRVLRSVADGATSAPSHTGRPRTPGILKTFRHLHAEHAFDDVDFLRTVDRSTAVRLLETCRTVEQRLVRARQALERAAEGHSRRGVLLVDADRVFALRAQRQLRPQASMIRLVHSFRDALPALNATTACAIINVFLPDGCGVDLSRQIQSTSPGVRLIYITSRPADQLPPQLRRVEPLVPKTSGLRLLKLALADALIQSVAPTMHDHSSQRDVE